MAVELVILGSGTSHGIPMIGCDCPVCTSRDKRDKRTRCSAAFRIGKRTILIDTAPELRLQCLATGIKTVDAILYTHHHADHIAGLDDVRRFNWINKAPMHLYGSTQTLDRIRQSFAYAFEHDPNYPSAKPDLRTVEIRNPFKLFGRTITPIPYRHGPTEVLGFRIGNIAYCPDCNNIPDKSRKLLRGLEVLVLDALRRTPHPTHFTIDQAIDEARRIGAKRTYFTHIAHELKHAATERDLPRGVKLAFDGLRVESER
ncbi:MAG: MBL fold metallo-hydrolase [Phycisphaerae bacterium]